MTKITKKTRLNEILARNENAGEILMNVGMSCVGCPMAMQETLEEGCLAHGMNEKDINKIVEELNK